MSSETAIRFEGVGKEYRLGTAMSGGFHRYKSLGERVSGALRNPLRAAMSSLKRSPSETFWALRDVSFEVQPGEVVGIIGRNGAGKSTLLKVLSQITKPTEGQIAIRGRVGSLLEVGTGFHPELTGRENIFLNGAILGMTRREVKQKFDEIVAFSEVQRFLDTPVKQYSSGMYTRLAFAVAAHLDPEILVVDEVLAVGDAAFQKKCLGRMKDVASGGRTVLFVSHNMAAIASLCTTCTLLNAGRVQAHGRTDDIIPKYLDSGENTDEICRPPSPSGKPTITKAVISYSGSGIDLRMRIALGITGPPGSTIGIEVFVTDSLGRPVSMGSLGLFCTNDTLTLEEGETHTMVGFPIGDLAVGSYSTSIALSDPMVCLFDELKDCFGFEVIHTDDSDCRPLLQSWNYGSHKLKLVYEAKE